MNTLIFLGGAGLGSLVCCLILLSALRYMSKSSKENNAASLENNRQSIAELKARNAIGERQVAALEKLAAECEKANREN